MATQLVHAFTSPQLRGFLSSFIIVALSLKPRLNQDIAIKIDFEV